MNTSNTQNPRFKAGGADLGRLFRFAAGALAVVVASIAAGQSEDLPFDSGSTGADGPLSYPLHPSAREEHAMGFDVANGEMVIFGGYLSSTHYPETWISNGDGWQLVPTATFVSARYGAAMAWDSINNELIMFGGLRADGVYLNEMWAWDGEDWTARNVESRPSARYAHSMARDPATGHIYVYGGRGVGNVNLNDIWRWNGTTWTALSEVGTPPPVIDWRYQKATWDSADQSLLLFQTTPARRTFRFKNGTWSEVIAANAPNPGHSFALVYHPVRDASILFGGTSHLGQTWEFKNNEWAQVTTTRTPARRYFHAAAYDPVDQSVVISMGNMDQFLRQTQNTQVWQQNFDTWEYKNNDWTYRSGRYYEFDMSSRANGIWNFTTISIPNNAEVTFKKNASNTPVVWLASGQVRIDGVLFLDGETSGGNAGADNYAQGGPGGFAGGLGGIRFDVSGSYAGTPGQGPGGGLPGVNASQAGGNGTFRNVYGNTLLLPLVGGSGGGGGASSASANGGHGSGGGGAILIASSRDIEINGLITAESGGLTHGGATWGGYGSGGAIKLMADRVVGSGYARTRNGANATDDRSGRIRIEAFFRPFAARTSPPPSATAPIEAPNFGDMPTLSVLSVAGANVAQPPTGNLQTPDVVFTAAGQVTITVVGTNVPVGTPVTLRITTSGEIINLPGEGTPVLMGANNQAVFQATVPAGIGTIQAFTEFNP